MGSTSQVTCKRHCEQTLHCHGLCNGRIFGYCNDFSYNQMFWADLLYLALFLPRQLLYGTRDAPDVFLE